MLNVKCYYFLLLSMCSYLMYLIWAHFPRWNLRQPAVGKDRCLRSKRPSESITHNLTLVPASLRFKAEKHVRAWFYEIGCLFCTPIHSKFHGL